MRYFPHTPEEVAQMLAAVGAATLEDLFAPIPEACRTVRPLDLPEALTEWELEAHLGHLAARTGAPRGRVFLGAGSYDHFIPAAVPAVAGRAEFLTSYTPYQPEVSQGTLQAIYEYQTLGARLLGMEVANASLYDGASALAEGVLLALRVTKRTRLAVSRAVHPAYRRVLATYLEPTDFETVELPYGEDGRTDLSALNGIPDLAAVAVQSPNFFGCVEDLSGAAEAAHAGGGLLVACFTEPLAFGLLQSPGAQGADVACGEGQSLGLPPSFGGPGLGLFAARQAHLRNLPGRLVGKARDRNGRRGFVLTLATREQHIRRERATSNVCTNQSHCALTAAAYLACLGKQGLRELARLNYDKAEHLKGALAARGIRPRFSAPTFHEFVVRWPGEDPGRYEGLLEKGFVPGLPLERDYPELAGCTLLCATETKSRADLEALAEAMAP
ncbi:MAG: aminomethyl-transferring glycine dehydrogenase subunit GcvPA [Thermodesulfobacteriota bacterium]